MTYNIRMGIPEMAELWNRLQTSYRDGTINKKDAELYKKWGSAIKKLAMNPQYPSLNLDSRINMTRLEPPLRVLHIFQLAC